MARPNVWQPVADCWVSQPLDPTYEGRASPRIRPWPFMSVVLKTVDQVLGSPITEGPRLSFEVGRITARELVRERVRLEVERYNSSEPQRGLVLVEPAKEECELNGARSVKRRPLDAERQIAVALEAMRRGRVVILFNGVQVSDLDAPLVVTPISEARFLKLVPLVGG